MSYIKTKNPTSSAGMSSVLQHTRAESFSEAKLFSVMQRHRMLSDSDIDDSPTSSRNSEKIIKPAKWSWMEKLAIDVRATNRIFSLRINRSRVDFMCETMSPAYKLSHCLRGNENLNESFFRGSELSHFWVKRRVMLLWFWFEWSHRKTANLRLFDLCSTLSYQLRVKFAERVVIGLKSYRKACRAFSGTGKIPINRAAIKFQWVLQIKRLNSETTIYHAPIVAWATWSSVRLLRRGTRTLFLSITGKVQAVRDFTVKTAD
jgi:hypothetical protein